MEAIAGVLREAGVAVESRWHQRAFVAKTLDASALTNLSDIESSHVFLAFTEQRQAGVCTFVHGGRHVELGYAIATNKECIIVGYRENVFHYLRSVKFTHTAARAVAYLLERFVLPEEIIDASTARVDGISRKFGGQEGCLR
jgi:hypothetical protein